MKIVEAHSVKRDIIRYSFFERSHIATVTEGVNNADVLSISSAMFAYEYEIKVSKSDLDKELAAIEYALLEKSGKKLAPANTPEQTELNLKFAGLRNKSGGWSKISKHKEYTNVKEVYEKKNTYYGRAYAPNYFYFVVPDRLVSYLIPKIEGTGYGVIAYDGCRSNGQHRRWNSKLGKIVMEGCDDNCYKEVAVKLKPKRLHSNKIDNGIIMSMLSRACTENYYLLEKIIALETREANV